MSENNAKDTDEPTPPPLEAWAEYARRKSQWKRDNPDASPKEYSLAMQRIADELGL